MCVRLLILLVICILFRFLLARRNMAACQSNDTVFHPHECNGIRFVLPTRYENPFIAGRGASSIVM